MTISGPGRAQQLSGFAAQANANLASSVLDPRKVGAGQSFKLKGKDVSLALISVNPNAQILAAPAPFAPRPGFARNNAELAQRASWASYDFNKEQAGFSSDIPAMYAVPGNAELKAVVDNTPATIDDPDVAEFTVGALHNGKLDLTLLLPVSAHNGMSNARNWATTDKFNVRVQGPGVDKTMLFKSQDLLSMVDMTLDLKKGRTTLTYWRDQSAGVAGFEEGRTIHLDYDGALAANAQAGKIT